MPGFDPTSINNQLANDQTLKQCSPHHYQILSRKSQRVIVDIWPTKRKFLGRGDPEARVGTVEELLEVADRLGEMEKTVIQTIKPEKAPTGISLLDHFAGLAIQGWLASYGDRPTPGGEERRRIVGFAYDIAEEMVEQSKERHNA